MIALGDAPGLEWKRRSAFVVPLLILCGTLRSVLSSVQEPYHLPFDYSPISNAGPNNWKSVNTTGNIWEQYIDQEFHNLDRVHKNICHSKRRPSPINLIANQICDDSHEILTRKIRSDDCKFDALTFSITPHTLQANFPNNDNSCTRPTIDLPNGYPFTWIAHHIEIHLRAEHVLDGRRYDGEMQMYHLGREDQKRELSAVSVLLDASAENDDPKLQQYIDEWEALAGKVERNCQDNTRTRRRAKDTNPMQLYGTANKTRKFVQAEQQHTASPNHLPRCAVDSNEHKDSRASTQDTIGSELMAVARRRKMFPYDIWPTIHFYRYRGSLTSPPCTEFVSWRVLDEPLLISRRQLKALARLLTSFTNPDTCENDSAASPTGETFRPLQELNHKTMNVTHCTEEHFTYRLYPANQI